MATSSTDEECAVCYEPYQEGRNKVLLPCAHCVCGQCYSRIMQHHRPACPFCRTALGEMRGLPPDTSKASMNIPTSQSPPGFGAQFINHRLSGNGGFASSANLAAPSSSHGFGAGFIDRRQIGSGGFGFNSNSRRAGGFDSNLSRARGFVDNRSTESGFGSTRTGGFGSTQTGGFRTDRSTEAGFASNLPTYSGFGATAAPSSARGFGSRTSITTRNLGIATFGDSSPSVSGSGGNLGGFAQPSRSTNTNTSQVARASTASSSNRIPSEHQLASLTRGFGQNTPTSQGPRGFNTESPARNTSSGFGGFASTLPSRPSQSQQETRMDSSLNEASASSSASSVNPGWYMNGSDYIGDDLSARINDAVRLMRSANLQNMSVPIAEFGLVAILNPDGEGAFGVLVESEGNTGGTLEQQQQHQQQ